MSRTVLLELLSILPSTHISVLSERLFIACISSITLFLRWLCWCTSSYKVVILNTFNLSVNPDIVCTKYVEVNMMFCWLRCHTLHRYFIVQSILATAWIWNDLTDDVRSAKSLSSVKKKLKPISLQKKIPTIVFLSCLGLLQGTDPCDVSGLLIMDLCFLLLCTSESAIR